ncbi:MAG: mucoidy inhibitor MuiA family protein [Candidatus Omnitrophica bacterium]|nr:mucoidy inhibitor MuiA family protein [Candidatus Omnitrophota bacterium]
MKRVLPLFLAVGLIILGARSFASAADIEAQSAIAQVTVYPDSALLTRVVSLKLSPGEYKVVFSGIIPEVDENSLRVTTSDTSAVKLFGARLKREYLKDIPSEQIQQLKDQLQKMQDEFKALENTQQVLSEKKSFLDSLRLFTREQLPKDLITKVPSAKELDDTYGFLDGKLKENYSQALENELKKRGLAEKITAARRQLAEMSGSVEKLKRSITVDLEVEKAATFDLSISYLVGGAYWEPIYDARAAFDKSEVELVSHGIVRQSTGEDWTDVEMVLSTAKPAIGGRMPYVDPWFLRPYIPRPAMVAESRVMSKAMMQRQAFDKDEEMLAGAVDSRELEEKAQYAAVEQKGIAVAYKLPRKASAKCDGADNKLAISSQILKADFEYSSYPRAILSAYLGSRVTNAPDLQLLGGRVNIFLDGDFVGISSIDNIGPGEQFDLYLGADESVKVKREQVTKKVDQTLIAGIPSPAKKTTFKYKLTVENYKSQKIKVKLFEAMPVSEDDRIKVKIDKVSQEPAQKDWKDRKGVWLWELSLEPKAKQEIFYTYIVEHPRELQIEGL